MQRWISIALVLAVGPAARALAGQAPGAANTPDIPSSGRDRVYLAEQFSNTVSVIDPEANRNLGVIRLGDPQPANLSPLYRGQLLVHGLGFSPDHRTLAVVSIGSNSVTFIDTATNTVKHVAYVGRSPHEAFFTPDGREVWVTVRGEDHVAVLDAKTYREKELIRVPNGPGMTIFSPDGKYGYVCSSFTPETVVVSTRDHRIVGRVKQESPFCPNIAATPEGDQVWFTLKDVGKVQVFQAKPPFQVIRVIDTGPITNHVNFARTAQGRFAYVTVGGLNQVKVFRTEGDFAPVATIPVGALPHGVWPSGDGTRVYVGRRATCSRSRTSRGARGRSSRWRGSTRTPRARRSWTRSGRSARWWFPRRPRLAVTSSSPPSRATAAPGHRSRSSAPPSPGLRPRAGRLRRGSPEKLVEELDDARDRRRWGE